MRSNQALFRLDADYFRTVVFQHAKLNPPKALDQIYAAFDVTPSTFHRATKPLPKRVSFRNLTNVALAVFTLWEGDTGRKTYGAICDGESLRHLPEHLRNTFPSQTAINDWVDYCEAEEKLDASFRDKCDGDGDATWAAIQETMWTKPAETSATDVAASEAQFPPATPMEQFSPKPVAPGPTQRQIRDEAARSSVDCNSASGTNSQSVSEGHIAGRNRSTKEYLNPLAEHLGKISIACRAELINAIIFACITALIAGTCGFFAANTSIAADAMKSDIDFIGMMMNAVENRFLVKCWAIVRLPSAAMGLILGLPAGLVVFLMSRRRHGLIWRTCLAFGICTVVSWSSIFLTFSYLTSLVLPVAILMQDVAGTFTTTALCAFCGFSVGFVQAAFIQALAARFPAAFTEARWRIEDFADWVKDKLN